MTTEEQTVLEEVREHLWKMYEQDAARTTPWALLDKEILEIHDTIQSLLVLASFDSVGSN